MKVRRIVTNIAVSDTAKPKVSSWFKVDLGDAMLAVEALSDLKVRLSDIYIAAGRPGTMLALYRHESEGLHCSIVVYLTDELQRAAVLEDAPRCSIPPLSDSAFLAGNESYISTTATPRVSDT